MLSESYEFDVFISYSHKDAEWVTDILLPRLEKTGLKVCIDNRDFIAGETTLSNMQESIKKSRRILLVLTPNWVRSRWTKLEAEIAQITPTKDVENRIVPLMWKRCTIPEHLGRLTWVDFAETDHPSHDAWRQLLRSLGVPEGKIRQQERESPASSKPPVEIKKPVHKIQRLLVFSVISITLIALVGFTALNRYSIAQLITTPTMTFTETETLPPTETERPLPTQTVVPTIVETATNGPAPIPFDMPTATPDPRCIYKSIWEPSSTTNSVPTIIGDCYDLNAWGISTLDNTYSFFLYGKSRAELYGLSKPVPKDSTVTFQLRVNRLRDGEFWFGFSRDTNPLLNGIYFVALPDGKFHLRVYTGGIQTEDFELDVPNGSSYQITLKLEGTKLTPSIYVYGAGTWTYPSQYVAFTDRRFYVGIQPLANGFVDTALSALTVIP